MHDLMRLPPDENRVTRVGKEALAGGAVTIVAVLAVSLLLSFVVTAVEIGAAILVIGGLIWYLLFRRK
jgi:hypothetical protein